MDLRSHVITRKRDQEDQSVEEDEDEAHARNENYCQFVRLLEFFQLSYNRGEPTGVDYLI